MNLANSIRDKPSVQRKHKGANTTKGKPFCILGEAFVVESPSQLTTIDPRCSTWYCLERTDGGQGSQPGSIEAKLRGSARAGEEPSCTKSAPSFFFYTWSYEQRLGLWRLS